jgi:nucleoside-diphosphate-sugar epimerase
MQNKKILTTGANGFVGKSLCAELRYQGNTVLAAVRSLDKQAVDVDKVLITSIGKKTDWYSALQNVEVVIHLAARVHVMNEVAVNPLAEFRKVNVDGTLNLAIQAAKAGVKHFIFVSSVKVNGEHILVNCPFAENDAANPQDAYGLSKHEAEQGLLSLAAESKLEVVITRPLLKTSLGLFMMLIFQISIMFLLQIKMISGIWINYLVPLKC